ncbi:MAG: hypothetical protein WC788_01820 [Candidatus Paceibacterota bacterium]|jgi:hypothetical protein
MRKVAIRLKDGKIEMDFEGFPNKTCDYEELKIRSLLEKMGVETDVQNGRRKEKEKEPVVGKEKIRA